MRLLVTGGAGYVGSVLTPMLLAAGHRVVVLDSLRYGSQGLQPSLARPDFRLVEGDVRDPAAVREAAREGCDAVVHLAAIVGYPTCLEQPELARSTNVEGTQTLLGELGGDAFVVYGSTGSNYGRVDGVCSEESPLNPISLYAETKAAAEDIVMSRGNSTSLRFATAFGVSPRMRFDLLINDFVRRAVVERKLVVYEGHFRRTFLHVHDLARAIVLALARRDATSGQVFNVGTESLNVTKADIAEMICSRIPCDLHYSDSGHDPDVRDYDVSYAKIRELGYHAERTLDDGITEILEAVRPASPPPG